MKNEDLPKSIFVEKGMHWVLRYQQGSKQEMFYLYEYFGHERSTSLAY